jgi:tetratricopeptide (TPR) repeat protein
MAITLNIALAANAPAEPKWQQAYLAAHQEQLAGDYVTADSILGPVVKAALQTVREDALTAALFAEYASIQQDLGQGSRAEEFYRRSLAIWPRLRAFSPEQMVVLNSLATLYMERGQFAKAEELLKGVEQETLSSRTMPTFLKAEIFNTLGGLAFERRKFQQAESFYRRAISLAGTAFAAELGAALIGLGAVHLEAGDFISAAKVSEEALRVYEAALGPQHAELVTPLINIAISKRKGGDPESAEPFARRAIDVAERTLGPAHPHTAEALLEYSQILRQLHRKDDAKALESRARSILSSASRSDPSAAYTVDASRLSAASDR